MKYFIVVFSVSIFLWGCAQTPPLNTSETEGATEDFAYYIYFEEADELYHAQKFTLAIEAYSKSIELNPDYMLAYDQRSKAYTLSGQYEAAIEDLLYLIQVEPNNAYYHYHFGMTLFQSGRIDDAILRMTRVIEIDPSYDDAYGVRGYFYSKLGRTDLTCGDFIAACNQGNCEALSDVPEMCEQYVSFENILERDKTEFRTVYRNQPEYPPGPANQGIEGYAIVAFAISEAGSPEEIEIVFTNLPEVFIKNIFSAVKLWKYEPRKVNGIPVRASGVRERITFSLGK